MRTPRTVETVPYLLPGMRTVIKTIKVCAHPRATSMEVKRDEKAILLK